MTRPVRWTPRARRLGRALQTVAGGLFCAALIIGPSYVGWFVHGVTR